MTLGSRIPAGAMASPRVPPATVGQSRFTSPGFRAISFRMAEMPPARSTSWIWTSGTEGETLQMQGVAAESSLSRSRR